MTVAFEPGSPVVVFRICMVSEGSVSPEGPWGPVAPVMLAPAGPVGPYGPWGPCMPRGPLGPGGFGLGAGQPSGIGQRVGRQSDWGGGNPF